MHETDDAALLRQYVDNGSQDAFAQLVDRYIDLVYSSARRQVADSDLAGDVTQAVFIILSKKAARLNGDRSLMAWLLKVTHFASRNARRKRANQLRHETRAAEQAQKSTESESDSAEWEAYSPLLDEGIAHLREKDRQVLVMRYFGQKNNREVAQALGISEEAAQKRAVRAVEKLRGFFRRRGVVVSVVGLTAGMTTRSIQAAPGGLSAGISSAAGAGAAGGAGAASIAKGAILAMAYAKSKAAVVAAIVALFLIGGGTIAYKAILPDRSRSVDVVAPTTVAVAKAPPSPWRATFSDGSAVDLLALTDKPGLGPWWIPDGSRGPAPVPLPRNTLRIKLDPGYRVYQFNIRHTGSDLASKSLWIDLSRRSVGSSDGTDGTSDEQTTNFVSVIEDTPMVNMQLKLAAGPWEAEERYDFRIAGTQPIVTTAPAKTSLEIRAIGEKTVAKETQTTITVRRLMPLLWSEREESIKAVTRDGKLIGPIASSGFPNGVNEYDFPITKDKIAAVLFRYRAYEVREIRNISLRPGVKTTPVVVAGATVH